MWTTRNHCECKQRPLPEAFYLVWRPVAHCSTTMQDAPNEVAQWLKTAQQYTNKNILLTYLLGDYMVQADRHTNHLHLLSFSEPKTFVSIDVLIFLSEACCTHCCIRIYFQGYFGFGAIYNPIYGLLLWVTQRQLSHFWQMVECWSTGMVRSTALQPFLQIICTLTQTSSMFILQIDIVEAQ